MRQKVVWFTALLLVVAVFQGVSATGYSKQLGVGTYTLYVHDQKIPIIAKNGVIQIPNTPGLDRKEVFMAVNRYFSLRHRQLLGASSHWIGSSSDYEQREAFSIPHQGDVYISAYASLNIEKDQFSVVAVGGYSSAACWIQPYDYWWSQDYRAENLTLGVELRFVAIRGSVHISIPPGIDFQGTSDETKYSITLHNTDYAGVDFDNIEATALFGIWRVEDHTIGTFYFSKARGTEYIQGANVIKVRRESH
ncbi:hypothetical protein [Thermococcus henrietii]|uniref:hypothetical protein n=1 Tax=Thermococcus henrietii TaxID=2016361 RepID=UPI000C08268C|nr:hypothetical protein [Thermococcus henrietii]